MSRPHIKSALNPDPQPLWPGIGCSVLFHGAVGMLAMLVSWLGPLLVSFFPSCAPEPLISDSVEVSLVSLPKRLNVPDKAERAPRVQEKPQPPTPEPPKPDPVKESDLVVKTDEPEPEPDGNVEDEVARQRALDELLREEALDDLLADAPEGEVDRLPTDPDGEVGADPAIAVLGARSQGDPAFARWKAQVVTQLQQRFKPVGSNEGLVTIVHVWFDPRSGKIQRWAIGRSSGVLSFDSAAERAIAGAGTIPTPPATYEPLFDVEYVEIEMVPPK